MDLEWVNFYGLNNAKLVFEIYVFKILTSLTGSKSILKHLLEGLSSKSKYLFTVNKTQNALNLYF